MARRRRAVFFVWVIALLLCMTLSSTLKQVLSAPDYSVDNSQSSQVERQLSRSFPGAGSEQDALVFYSRGHRATDRAFRAVVARVLSATRSQAGVVSILGPYGRRGARATISADGHAAVARVALGGSARERFKNASAVQTAVARASGGGVQAWLTGFSSFAKDLAQVESADSERAEAIGVPVALVILLLAFGAFAAATVPLAVAGAGLLLTYGVIAVLARVLSFDVFLLTIVTMIGVGIGIDYSLFIVSRFREELARTPENPRGERRRIADAVGASVATSGRTIVYSGVIVGLSLTSLLVIRAPIFREFVVGAIATVVCALAAALTLLPAVLAQLGPRINAGSLPARLRPWQIRSDTPEGGSGWARWALAMMRHPLLTAGTVSILLIVSMAPLLGIKYGLDLALTSLSETPSGKGAQVLAHSFSPGMAGPVNVVVLPADSSSPAGSRLARTRHGAQALAVSLREDRRVAGVTLTPDADGDLVTAISSVPIDSRAADTLVQHIRTSLASTVGAHGGPRVLVGGWTALSVDASAAVSSKLPVVMAITLGLALMFLLVVFRSVVLPIKAVLMNLLATGATLGLVVLIFQDGHGESLLNFTSTGFVQAFLPMSMFVLLFGLSMDYEVFLIRRMQETWQKTGDNRLAVVAGVEHTARSISAAAAIMVAVFGSFVTANILELKQFGFALAGAIAIDATLVRLVLVPALMCMLGERNWWLPVRVGRLLPKLEID
ncbi:MAG TPA: MMPL family transporter [Solirubrobacteraceae bacterium]|jgi:RND superfamily putative drug exporter|nr:MMPL family transporter [Solirubrobacteraceae bacterium]